MTDWFDELDLDAEDEVAVDDEDEIAPDAFGASRPDAEPEARPALTLEELEAMAAKPGFAQDLWKELLVAREEREAKAAAEELALKGQVIEESGQFDLMDPAEVRAAIEAKVVADRQAADADFLARRAAEYKASGFGDEDVNRWMKADQQALKDSAWFFDGADQMYESEAFRSYASEKAQAARARVSAFEMANRGRTIEDDARDAADAILESVTLASA